MKQGSTVIFADVPSDLHQWTKAYAATTGRKMREVIIEALELLRTKVTKKNAGK